jgi:hypothetical protein
MVKLRQHGRRKDEWRLSARNEKLGKIVDL